jgi:outer membrane protein OmpA-like peptidoglycan-associated protein
MKRMLVWVAWIGLALAPAARADDLLDQVKKTAVDKAKTEGTAAAKGAAQTTVVDKVNKKLLDEGRKNQCAFKTDSDELEKGCDQKLKKLASSLVDAKKALASGGIGAFKFVVSGHTDTTGDAQHNRDLSGKRAAVIVKELVGRGVAAADIEAIGMGAERPLVKPDNTAAKRAKNRRYEIQVKI